jgi:hypothetical protein
MRIPHAGLNVAIRYGIPSLNGAKPVVMVTPQAGNVSERANSLELFRAGEAAAEGGNPAPLSKPGKAWAAPGLSHPEWRYTTQCTTRGP